MAENEDDGPPEDILTDDSASSCPTSHNDDSCNSYLSGSESDSSSHDDFHQDDTADGQDALEVEPNAAAKKSYDEFKSSQEREICCNRHGLLLVCGFDGIGNTQQCGMHEATDDQMAALYKRVLSRKRELKNERYSTRKIEDFALNIVDGAWNLECGRQGESGVREPDLVKPEREKPRKVKKPKEKSVPAPPEFDPTEATKEPDVARAPAGVDESEEEKQRRDDLHKLSDLLSSAVRHLTDGVFDVARGKLEECQGVMGDKNSKQLLDANNYAVFQYCYIKTLVQSEDVVIFLDLLREFDSYISEESGSVSDSNVRASCNFLHILLSAQYCCRWNEPQGELIKRVLRMEFPEPLNYPSVNGQPKTAIEESKQENLRAEFERIMNSLAPSLVMKCCTDSINVQYKPIHRRTEMFLGDPDCDNYVQTECGNKCVLQFHQRCWEDFLQKRNFPEDYVQSGHFPCLQCDSQVTKFDRFEWDEETDEFLPIAIEVSVQPQTASIEQPDEASVGDSADKAIPAEPDIPANLSENTVDTEEKPKKKRAQKENIIVDTSDDPTNSSTDSCNVRVRFTQEDHQRSRSTSGVSSVEEEGAKTDKVAQEVLEEAFEKTVENLNVQGDFEENTNDLGPTISQEQLSAVTTCSVGVQSDAGLVAAEKLWEECEKLKEQKKKGKLEIQSLTKKMHDKGRRVELLEHEVKTTKAENERLRQTEKQRRTMEEQLKEAETQLEKERDRSKSFKANASALKAENDKLKVQQPEASMKNEFKEMKSKVDQLEKDLHSERDRTTSHKANAAQMKTENNKLQEAAKKVPEYEERIQKLEQELQTFNEKNASLNEKHTATNKARTEELVARATSAELALVGLKKGVEITKLRQVRGNAENNIGHCNRAMDKILAKQPLDRPQLDQWQRQKFKWENVVQEIEQIIQTQEQGYNRLLAGLNSGASLAMMEPVPKPTMPKAPEPPRDQSAQRAVLAPINVQTPIDRASPPNNRSAFHPGPPPGFSPGFQSSNGRSTPAESTTSSVTSGHSAPVKPGVTKPQVQNAVKSSSFDKIIPSTPAVRPAMQQPPPPSQPVQNGAKSSDLIGKIFEALKDQFVNLTRAMVVTELFALRERRGGKINATLDNTIQLIADALTPKLQRAMPPPPNPPATVHRTISDRDHECVICQEEMGFKNLVECKECREKYHDHCVNKWFETKRDCPKCRSHLLPENDYPPLQ